MWKDFISDFPYTISYQKINQLWKHKKLELMYYNTYMLSYSHSSALSNYIFKRIGFYCPRANIIVTKQTDL